MSNTFQNKEIADINLNEEWQIFKNNVGFDDKVLLPKQKNKKKFSIYSIAATISAIQLLSVATLYFFKPKQEVVFAQNQVVETNLPDGT